MFEKILPVVLALIALQFIVRFMNRKKTAKTSAWRELDYKRKIDELMKIGNFDDANTTGKSLQEEVKARLAKPELYMDIPDNKRDVRRGLNLVIDAVTTGVRAKTGSGTGDMSNYNDPAKMFDEIVEVVKKHKIDQGVK
ncbi:MAG TPA: hypothetical protein PK514_06500 [Spirochaetota bacterium]|nr:hypothetical protein [Spirochaetota bacterium]